MPECLEKSRCVLFTPFDSYIAKIGYVFSAANHKTNVISWKQQIKPPKKCALNIWQHGRKYSKIFWQLFGTFGGLLASYDDDADGGGIPADPGTSQEPFWQLRFCHRRRLLGWLGQHEQWRLFEWATIQLEQLQNRQERLETTLVFKFNICSK